MQPHDLSDFDLVEQDNGNRYLLSLSANAFSILREPHLPIGDAPAPLPESPGVYYLGRNELDNQDDCDTNPAGEYRVTSRQKLFRNARIRCAGENCAIFHEGIRNL